jgi:FlaA1/EpsC-like NDP-sugar epimerase
MPEINRTRIKNTLIFMLADLVIILAAYSVVYFVRVYIPLTEFVGSFWHILLAAVIMLVLMWRYGVYRRIWERTSGHEIAVIVVPVAIATIITLVINLITRPRPLPLSVILVSNTLSLAGFVAARYRSRLLNGATRRWSSLRHQETGQTTHVMIVGAGEAGQTLAWRLKYRTPEHPYTVIGFVDDDPRKQSMFVEGCPVLGSRRDIPQIAEKRRADLIAVAIHNISGADFRDILNYCEQTAARIKVVPDVLGLIGSNGSQELLRDVQPEDLLGRTTITRHEAVDLTPVIGKTILVTGAAGSIGSELCRQLVTYQPVQLLLLDNNESGLYDLESELKAAAPQLPLIIILADITRREQLLDVFDQYHPQIVFHAAAYKHVPMMELYPDEAVRINIGGTRNLAELAYDYEVERFVLISTDKAIKPSSVMGATKHAAECLLHALSQEQDNTTRFTSVRFGNVLGSRGSVVPLFTRQIDSGGPVTVTHPDMTRYFMSIPEAVNLVIHAACLTEGDDMFFLQMGEVVRIVDLAERMIRLRGLRPGVDVKLEFTGVRPGEKMHEELYDPSETVESTLHPHIVKIRSWPTNFDPARFLKSLDELAATNLKHHDNVTQFIMNRMDEGLRDSTLSYG